MKLKDILIAKTVGGLFHPTDAFFQTDISSFVKGITSLIKKAQKQGKIKHDYLVSLFEVDDSQKKQVECNHSLKLQCADQEMSKLYIVESGISFDIGALLKQGNFFNNNGYLWEAIVLIDEIVRFRKVTKSSAYGINPQFAIPFTKEVAPQRLSNLLFSNVLVSLGVSNAQDTEDLSFYSQTLHKKINLLSFFKTNKNKDTILASFDFRLKEEGRIKTYHTFCKQLKPLYTSICKVIIQNLIELEDIDEKLLLTNKPS